MLDYSESHRGLRPPIYIDIFLHTTLIDLPTDEGVMVRHGRSTYQWGVHRHGFHTNRNIPLKLGGLRNVNSPSANRALFERFLSDLSQARFL